MIYRQVPWFWSDQYNLRVQMVGVSDAGDDSIVRGSPADGRFSVLFFRDGKLSACHAINRPEEYMACRKILENDIELTMQQAGKADFDLKRLVPAKTRLAFQNREQQFSSIV